MLLLHFVSTVDNVQSLYSELMSTEQPPHLNTKHAFGIEKRKKYVETDFRIKKRMRKIVGEKEQKETERKREQEKKAACN